MSEVGEREMTSECRVVGLRGEGKGGCFYSIPAMISRFVIAHKRSYDRIFIVTTGRLDGAPKEPLGAVT